MRLHTPFTDVGGQAFNQSFDLKPLAAQGGVSSIIVAVMYLQVRLGWDAGLHLGWRVPPAYLPSRSRGQPELAAPPCAD